MRISDWSSDVCSSDLSSGRRYRELALLLPLAGLVLFMPPYLRILSREEQLFGIPVLHFYIFAVWLIGIVLSAAISRGLVRYLETGDGGNPRATDEKHDDQTRKSVV